MDYRLSSVQAGELFEKLSGAYDIYGPALFAGTGCFADTDVIRYKKLRSFDEIVWDRKSDYSFKEVLLPVNETLFYYTEDETKVPKGPQKEILIFLRSCDLHAVKRLDEIYLNNGFEDFYYARIRRRTKFALMGCRETCGSGFCVSMGTNRTEEYDLYMEPEDGGFGIGCCLEELEAYVKAAGGEKASVSPAFAAENKEKVTLPRKLSNESFTKEVWKEYGSRCIGCGRCNFVCPTCTCFTMQDIFYRDNEKAGERRRVWASCQVDGFTDIAGGITFRKDQGDRFRFKVMHKIYDYEKRFGYPMCVGCGRCDDVCPEYISYSNCVNKLAKEEELA